MAFIVPTLPVRPHPCRPSRWLACQTRSPPQPSAPSLQQSAPPPEYHDGPMAHFFLTLLRRQMSSAIKWRSSKSGYAGFVEECRRLMLTQPPSEQKRIVLSTLDALFFPPYGPTLFRRHLASPSLNAHITPAIFSWLVGSCSTNHPPEGGVGVHIERCRFLEESACKGLCVNMCQQPTQQFFTDTLGLPVRMTPDYTDLSCQMTFGVPPLPRDEDPALRSACFQECQLQGRRKTPDDACFDSA